MNGFETWKLDIATSHSRITEYETISGTKIEPLYLKRKIEINPGEDDNHVDLDQEFPGQYPYTRGIHPLMYRSKLWTMRMFAGFGTALDTNKRFKELLNAGGTGLSTAFDLPTLMGRDSDDARCEGEVGKCGVAIDTLDDMIDLFKGIDLAQVTTSMTINGPAAIVLASYIRAGELSGVERSKLGGTMQNDILKEYQAQKEYIFPPRPSMRLVTDTIRFCASEMPKWNSVSISGYHIREAGSTAVQEAAFTLANGFAYIEAAVATGMDVDEFAPRLSFFFNAHIDFFEEVAKYRAARRVWAKWLRFRYHAQSERSLALRFHTQTAGVSLTAQQPELNIVRTAIEALAGILGGTQSLHTNSMDEVLSLPTEKAARIALRTQQVIAHETGVTNVVDPLGGSYFIESLTDSTERSIETILARILDDGKGSILEGVYEGIASGYFVGEIADSAYSFERRVSLNRRIVVGVNDFLEGNNEEVIPTMSIGSDVETHQKIRLSKVKMERNPELVRQSLAELADAAKVAEINLMPFLMQVVDARATLGEVTNTLEQVFGTYSETIRY